MGERFGTNVQGREHSTEFQRREWENEMPARGGRIIILDSLSFRKGNVRVRKYQGNDCQRNNLQIFLPIPMTIIPLMITKSSFSKYFGMAFLDDWRLNRRR